jgi:hypothetical protein
MLILVLLQQLLLLLLLIVPVGAGLFCATRIQKNTERVTQERIRVACGKMVSIVQALLVNELLQLLVLLGKMRLLYLQLHKYGMRLSA